MRRREMFVFSVFVIGLLPVSLWALDQQTIEMQTKQLKMMSSVERDRLDRNIQGFHELSKDRQSHFRKLHADLAADRKESGGLFPLMETYSQWLQTLTPAQRDELQRETDTGKKLALVRRFKEELDHPVEVHDIPQNESLPQPAPKLPTKFAFDKKDLDAVMKVIVDGLPPERKREDFKQPSLEICLPILNASMQAFENDAEWPGDAMLLKITGAVRKESQKEIQKSGSKRDTVIRMTLMGVMRQAMDFVQEPTEEEKIQTTLGLSKEERDRILKLPPAQMKWWIRKKVFDSKGEDAKKSLTQLTTYRIQVTEMFDRLQVEPPPNFKRLNPRQKPLLRGKQ